MSVSAVAACFAAAAQPTTAASNDGGLVSPVGANPTVVNPGQVPGGFINLNAKLGASGTKAAAQKGPAAAGTDGSSTAESPRNPSAQKNTEFQRFVLEGTGRQVPLFGYELFEGPTFPSLTNVPVPTDYVIGPGDEIVLRIWGTVDVDVRTVVDRNGQISLPRVGTFRIAGTPASQLDSSLRAQVAKIYKNFELNATLGQLRAIQIFVVGQAKKPGLTQSPVFRHC